MNPKLQSLSLAFLLGVLFLSCNTADKKPRIGIAGIAIECSTFSPAQTSRESFRISQSDEVLKSYPFLHPDSVLYQQAEWLPAFTARATPGGIVTRETYDSLVKDLLTQLEKNKPYDALFFDIHGAMSVVGLDDPEGDLILKIREVIGNEPLISTSMDLHGCVSPRLAENTDLITCYRMAPHEDAMISKRRTVQNLMDRLLQNTGRPAYKAWVNVPILLPGEKTSTRVEPGKSLYAEVPVVADSKGVTDAAIWISYAWADEPRNHAVVMVTGDDKAAVEEGALRLAKAFWNVRDQFEFVAPTASLDSCLSAALKSDKKPYFISDMGDNPTAGGAGDVTWTLKQLLERKEFKSESGKRLIYASIPGPEVIAQALKVGKGGKVSAYAGAAVDNRYAPPILIEGVVDSVYQTDKNTEAVIRVGSMQVIVTEKRKPYHYEQDFVNLGLAPRDADIIVVKLGYLTEELYNMRGDWMMAQTRGGVDQDLEKLPYQRIQRPMYPLDSDMQDPEFKVEFIDVL